MPSHETCSAQRVTEVPANDDMTVPHTYVNAGSISSGPCYTTIIYMLIFYQHISACGRLVRQMMFSWHTTHAMARVKIVALKKLCSPEQCKFCFPEKCKL
jgi:hypothetical protein